ncbi:flavodoxin domain-containing protein [Cellulosilyticum sp. I15G10I2]|uniref:flavodoxin domain-containing protein n=1 Tax=Cellulosilyticum sp. I15G10I2 TaxID=1892843 RepID=UPI00085C874A|nr:flavodoxin domain-containing protein [Cellulosilyticum sp. I15G10I2]
MKTLITYASKHGAARKCAQMLKEKIAGDNEVIDLKNVKNIDLSQYDNVVIGGSIYVGAIQKQVTEFCSQNIEILKKKKIGLFISCMNENEAEKQLNQVFPQELLEAACVKKSCGGEFNFKSMNFMEKMIIKMISKAEAKNNPKAKPINIRENVSKLILANINEIAQAMQV